MSKFVDAVVQFNKDHGKASAIIVALIVGMILGAIVRGH